MEQELATSPSVTLEEALGPGSPIVVFDNVCLAFGRQYQLAHSVFLLFVGLADSFAWLANN